MESGDVKIFNVGLRKQTTPVGTGSDLESLPTRPRMGGLPRILTH